MALMKAKDVPSDAVVLNEIEAITYAWDTLNKLGTISETWALKFGPQILGGINSMTGIIINSHYRNKLKLGNYGYYSSLIPIALMPGMLTMFFHRHFISTDMLLMKNECSICYELRSGVIQIGFGTLYPMVLGPTSAMMFANRYATYRIPSLMEGPKVVLAFLNSMSKRLKPKIMYAATVQLVVSSLITFCEFRNNLAWREKLFKMEREAELEMDGN